MVEIFSTHCSEPARKKKKKKKREKMIQKVDQVCLKGPFKKKKVLDCDVFWK